MSRIAAIELIMDKTEQQMIERFIEMMHQAERAHDAADKMDHAAADFGYLATLQFPDFLDHVSELANQKESSSDSMITFNPASLVSHLLILRGFSYSIPEKKKWGLDRKPAESTRHWLERCEKIISQKRGTSRHT